MEKQMYVEKEKKKNKYKGYVIISVSFCGVVNI